MLWLKPTVRECVYHLFAIVGAYTLANMDRSINDLWLNKTPVEFVAAMTTGSAILGEAFL